MTPAERGDFLENPPEGDLDITATHQEMANMGQTAAPAVEESTDLHFVAIISRNEHVYELDGRKVVAVDHGQSTHDGDLLLDACDVVKKFMERSKSLNFNLIALAPLPE